MCLLVCICYMSVGVYLIKMNIYNFACEIIVYIHRESQRDQHAVVLYVCNKLFRCRYTHLHDCMVYKTTMQDIFKIYGKLYVEHYFMCIIIYFFTGIRLIVLSIISIIELIIVFLIVFFLQFELTKNLSLVYHILDIFGVSPNMYVMTVSFSSWLITAACLSKINKDKQQQLILYTLTQITHEN